MSLVHHIIRMVVLIVAVLAMSCEGNTKQAEQVARTFLLAYYVDLDFSKAQTLCSDISKATVAEQGEVIALNPYANDEVPELTYPENIRQNNRFKDLKNNIQ